MIARTLKETRDALDATIDELAVAIDRVADVADASGRGSVDDRDRLIGVLLGTVAAARRTAFVARDGLDELRAESTEAREVVS